MGVDAVMFAVVPDLIDETKLRQLSAKLVDCIGRESFFIDVIGKYGKPSHVLSIGDYNDITDRYILPERIHNNIIIVNLMGRYYGEDYERGHWPDYYFICLWLKHNLNAQVYYTGDNSNVCKLMSDEFLNNMNTYFLEIGHTPYQQYFGEKTKILCSYCGDRPMNDVGGGGSRTFWYCSGCGTKVITDSKTNSKLELEENADFFAVNRGLENA